jgi:hypothetical protein
VRVVIRFADRFAPGHHSQKMHSDRTIFTLFRASNLIEIENTVPPANYFRCELACSCTVITIAHLQIQSFPHNIGVNGSALQ